MTSSNLSPAIDAYGKLIAQIAELEKRKEAMQAGFKALEAGTHEGENYVLTISDRTREVPDKTYKAELAAVVGTFKASKSRQYLNAHVAEVPMRVHSAKAKAPREEVED